MRGEKPFLIIAGGGGQRKHQEPTSREVRVLFFERTPCFYQYMV